MADKRKPIKLFTWKYGVFIGAVFIFVVVFKLYRDYKLKSYLDRNDLISTIVSLIPFIVILLGIAYWGSRSVKRK